MLAHMYPNHVESLVLEDIGPDSTYESGMSLAVRIKKIPVPFKDRKAAKEYLLNDFSDPQLGTFLYTRLIQNELGLTWNFPMKMLEDILREGRSKDLWEEVRGLNCPTLVIRGAKSKELRPDEFQKMISINPNISGVTIEGAGHWVHFEKPEEFIEVVTEFLGNSWAE